MGAIIYWALVRFAVVLIGCWLMMAYLPDSGQWWSLFFVAFSVVVIYPAQLAFRKHQEGVRRASRNPLCATCKHFVQDSTWCEVTDEHVTRTYTPCNAEAWEPMVIEVKPFMN